MAIHGKDNGIMRLTPKNWISALFFALVAAWLGCGSGGVKEEAIKTTPPAAIEMAKDILQGYADGKPVESEFMRFDQIIEDAKKENPAKAAVLERGFGEIEGLMNTPSAIQKKAKEILAELESA
ncbi:MAG: hypothetical protein GXY83_31195 [Rhodopirellula sp.]|nr:hypothetical protein [Rhodopirellula sp.]